MLQHNWFKGTRGSYGKLFSFFGSSFMPGPGGQDTTIPVDRRHPAPDIGEDLETMGDGSCILSCCIRCRNQECQKTSAADAPSHWTVLTTEILSYQPPHLICDPSRAVSSAVSGFPRLWTCLDTKKRIPYSIQVIYQQWHGAEELVWVSENPLVQVW